MPHSTVMGGVSARRQIEIHESPSDAYAHALQALDSIRFSVRPDSDAAMIKADGPWNLCTFGDEVTIVISDAGQGRARISIASEPASFQMFDWGRSRRVVDRIAALLTVTSPW